MGMGKSFFKLSKWLHKYVGLCFLAIFPFMVFTGILINHPALLSTFSVPAGWLGQSYQYFNWNRFSFRDSLLLDDGRMFVAGKMGVFVSPRSGAAFTAMNSGLPDSFYLLDSNCLLATAYNGGLRLFVGGRSGLYFRDSDCRRWRAVNSAGTDGIVDLQRAGDRILAFSSHGCKVATVGMEHPVFEEIHLAMETKGGRVPGYRLLFELHSGKLFGFAGRLLVDFSALLLLFLCFSALYIWYLPWSRRRFSRKGGTRSWFLFLYSWHLSLGIWIAAMLFLIGGSGALVRPPLIVLASYWQIPLSWLNQETPEILKAAISDDGDLVLATRDGFYKGDSRLNSPLQPISPPLPVFGMGATVLESLANNQLLIGSFSGLYTWNLDKDVATDLGGNPAVNSGQLRPAEVMAAGVIMREGVLAAYADYTKGLQQVANNPVPDRPFPAELLETRISLYHFLFELHNGRFLRDLIGYWYILYVPLLGLALMLLVFTGTYDWLTRKITRLRRKVDA